MELLGLFPGQAAKAQHGVVLDPDEPSGLAGAAAFGEMGQHGKRLGPGQAGVK